MKIKKLEHLSEIFQEYDAFIIDLWGVMHNGVNLYNSAINAVRELQSNGGVTGIKYSTWSGR